MRATWRAASSRDRGSRGGCERGAWWGPAARNTGNRSAGVSGPWMAAARIGPCGFRPRPTRPS